MTYMNDCLLEDSALEGLDDQMNNVEFPWIDNDVNQYCGDAHQSDRARLENEQDLDDEENFSSIPTPPRSTSNSYLEAEKDLHDFSWREGFEITLGGGIVTNKNQNIYKRRLICAKGSRYVLGKSRETCSTTRPYRASKITGCKWAISIIASNIAEPGQGKWFTRLGNTPEHNHGAVHASGLSNHRHRARGNEVQVYLKNAITSGIDPKRARSLAYQQFSKNPDGENMFILKDTYNEKYRLRNHGIMYKTPIDIAIFISREGFFFDYECDDYTNAITSLFFAHRDMISILKENHQVLILDSTYRTNMYGLPLFTTVVVTRSGNTILVPHCFMEWEREPNFTWALKVLRNLYIEFRIQEPNVIFHDRDRACINALGSVFPNVPTILCSWHMKMDVEAWIMRAFGYDEDRLSRKAILNPVGQQAMEFFCSIIKSPPE
ncbi:hypothetical protein K3495_g11865 [Podosphaera aphanis]|nr:hypothetical protein K3495_g11865 [Podosphaera aphanis]